MTSSFGKVLPFLKAGAVCAHCLRSISEGEREKKVERKGKREKGREVTSLVTVFFFVSINAPSFGYFLEVSTCFKLYEILSVFLILVI